VLGRYGDRKSYRSLNQVLLRRMVLSVGHRVPRYIPKENNEWVPTQTAVPRVGTQVFEEYLGISGNLYTKIELYIR
jgi:hypothetical protein